jgi:membrane protein
MRNFLRTLYDAYLKFNQDDGWAIASYIALSILTSLFPFLIFLTALAGFFGMEAEADAATKLLFEAWPASVAAPISGEIRNVLTQPHGGLLTFGAVLAIYFSATGVEALRVALNRAYNLPEQRSWWLLRLESIIFVVLGAASLLAIAILLVLAPLARAIAQRYVPHVVEQLQPLYEPVRYGVTTAVLAIALFAAHKYLPATRRATAFIAPGIALTLLASLAFGVGFGNYLARFAGSYISTYAGLASIMIAIVFLQLLAAIFIYGAELNQTLATNRKTTKKQG